MRGWNAARKAVGRLGSTRRTFSDLLLGDGASAHDNNEAKQRVERAAAYVRDALDGRFMGAQWVETSSSIVLLKLLFHRFKFLRMAVMCAFLPTSFSFVSPSLLPAPCYPLSALRFLNHVPVTKVRLPLDLIRREAVLVLA